MFEGAWKPGRRGYRGSVGHQTEGGYLFWWKDCVLESPTAVTPAQPPSPHPLYGGRENSLLFAASEKGQEPTLGFIWWRASTFKWVRFQWLPFPWKILG